MKFTVALVLSFLGLCFAAVDDGVEVWGTETQNVLGAKKIEVGASLFEVKRVQFTYPVVRNNFIEFKLNY